jgi:phosphoglycerate dehydrogenase-like enzyme
MHIVLLSQNLEYRAFMGRLAQRLPGHRVSFQHYPSELNLEGVEAVLVAGAPARRDVLEKPSLGFVQTIGTGYDNVDLATADALGVWVANLRANATGNAESVAEHALLLLLALARRLRTAEESLRQGRWAHPTGMSLFGKVACIVGLGDIGGLLAPRLQALGMRVVGVREHAERGGPPGVQVFGASALHEALAQADCVVLAARAGASNVDLLDDAAVAAMKRGALLVNIARGSLVRPEVLERGVRSGQLGGVGLDVFWEEPVEPGHPLLQLPQVLATPHVAGLTDVNLAGSLEWAARNLEAYARRERPHFLVNAPATPRTALT